MKRKSFESIRVLLVEDEAFAQTVVVKILKSFGIADVTVATTGTQALDILKSAKNFFDLVIVDIEMPELGGLELTRRIRQGIEPSYKDVPILVLTGLATSDNVEKGRALGIQGFIVKPPSPDVLKRYMMRALGMK